MNPAKPLTDALLNCCSTCGMTAFCTEAELAPHDCPVRPMALAISRVAVPETRLDPKVNPERCRAVEELVISILSRNSG